MTTRKDFNPERGLTRLQIQTFIWTMQADRQDAERAKARKSKPKTKAGK